MKSGKKQTALKLRTARLKKGLSQQGVASRAGIHVCAKRACAHARARVRRPVNPSRAETISPWKNRFFRPVRRGFCPDGGPTGPVFAPLAALSPEKSAGKPGPGA